MTPVLDAPEHTEQAELPPIVLPDSRQLPRHRWTRDDVQRMLDLGLLDPSGRYELIEGEVIEKMGQNERHVFVCIQIIKALLAVFGPDRVRPAAPVNVNTNNDPEPDAAVVKGTVRDYLGRGTPHARDMELVVEVSDTTLIWDRGGKAEIYARAGVPEYWVVDINARALLVFRQPFAGRYTLVLTVTETESVSALAAPDATISVKDLLP